LARTLSRWTRFLVTNDRAFERIKKLKVEDWTKGARARPLKPLYDFLVAYDAACSYFFQPLANQSILVGVKCHQTAANFFCRYGSTGFRIPNTLIYGGESLLVLIIDDGSGILEIEIFWLRHGGLG
jgi:hypothetical protein